MKALVIKEPFNMQVDNWQDPQLHPGEVLISVVATGVCAGDLYYYTGKNPYAKYPQVCGHEISGTIIQVADETHQYLLGKPVVVEPFIACGTCYACRVGKSNCCSNLSIIGVHMAGGYSDFVKAPATHVHMVPDNLTLQTAVLAEPVTIAVQACNRAVVTDRDTVLVLGCGPIGMYLIDVLLAKKATVLAADINKERLAVAQSLGAKTFVADDNLLHEILQYTDGEGMPVVIEATGVPKVMALTVDLVAAGGRIVIIGLGKKGEMVTMPALDFTRKELTILGSRTEVNCFPEALRLLSDGHIRFAAYSTFFNIWEAPGLFAELSAKEGKFHKSILLRTG